ncbi:hypothetical protein [Bradyrhizobium sp. HKCCYLR1051]|uniref:hypothetical protein n=1 Tax=Bradyrhizobium sp. HKCCYLR1051 TaxID=3420738 RepID=UPI003EC02F54
MTLPTWPIATYMPIQDGFAPIQRMREPISTDMEGGNTRQRSRPGDNVGTLTQTLWITNAEHDTLVAWIKDTLGNGTGRFTMNVWLGTGYVSKTCQFVKGGAGVRYAWLSTTEVAVTMTLRVYGV